AGQVDLGGEVSAALDGEWSALRWPLVGEPIAASPRGTIELRGTPAALEARLAAGWDANGRIDGVVRRDGERIDIDLDWRDVSWPPDAPRLESSRGALQVSGTLDAYVLTLDAALAAAAGEADGWQAEGASGHVRAEGNGDRRSFDLELLDVAVLDGELEGSGRIEWDPSVAAVIDAEFARLDPGLLLPEWAGRIDGAIHARAAAGPDGFSADVARLDAAGTLRGRPLDLGARGRYDGPDRASIDELTLRSGQSTLAASGSVGERIDVEWRLDSNNLEDFWPGLAGSLSTSGRASGPRARPLVDAEAEGEALAFNGIEAAALSLTARLDVAGAADSSVALDVRGAQVADRSIERLVLRAGGTSASHRLSADVAMNGIEAALALRGAFDRPWEPDYAWRFELDEGRIAHSALPAWTLDGPSAGTLTAGGAELERSCFSSAADAALCIEAARRNSHTDVSVELSALPFAHFSAYLPPDTRVTGSVSGSGRLELAPELAPRVSVTLATTPGRITATGAGAAVAGLAFAQGRAALAF